MEFDTTNKIFDLIKEIQTGTNTSFWERSLLELSFDCYKSLEIPRKVVKLKTYMLILNCCINVLSHRNRFEYRTVLLNISGAELNKRSIGSATKILNANQIDLDNLWYLCLFQTFFRCHVKELIGAILWLSKSNQQGNVNFSKNWTE